MSLQGTAISQSAIGINTLVCPSPCPSVRLSVMLSVVVLSVGVGVKSCTTVFLGWYFVFTCMDVSFCHISVGCIVQLQRHSEKRTAKISTSGIAMWSMVAWLWLFQTRHFWQFSFAAIPYIVHSTISQTSLLSDSHTSCYFSLHFPIKLLDLFIFFAVPFFFIPLFFNFLFGFL